MGGKSDAIRAHAESLKAEGYRVTEVSPGVSYVARDARVEVPEWLSHLPLDVRGYPVFYLVYVRPDGTPDFRVIDERKKRKAVRSRLCGLCGKGLGLAVYFVGGPASAASRMYTEAPMHERCARYALRTCPFLCMPKARYRDMTERDRERLGEGMAARNLPVSEERPDVFVMIGTPGYTEERDGILRAWTVTSREEFPVPAH